MRCHFLGPGLILGAQHASPSQPLHPRIYRISAAAALRKAIVRALSVCEPGTRYDLRSMLNLSNAAYCSTCTIDNHSISCHVRVSVNCNAIEVLRGDTQFCASYSGIVARLIASTQQRLLPAWSGLGSTWQKHLHSWLAN